MKHVTQRTTENTQSFTEGNKTFLCILCGSLCVLCGSLCNSALFAEEAEKRDTPDIEIKIHFVDVDRGMVELTTSRLLVSKGDRFQHLFSFGEDWNTKQTEGHTGLTEGFNYLDVSCIIHVMGPRYTDPEPIPRAIVKSGTHVTVKNTQAISPTAYEGRTVAVTNGTEITYKRIWIPRPWATQEVGTVWSVLPTWNPESEMIDLANLTATLVIDDEPTWDAGYATFPSFAVSTNLSIRSGENTLLEVGTRTEKIKYESQVPILGDIPLLGRLFRSKYEVERERVLLVFVTARVLDPQ